MIDFLESAVTTVFALWALAVVVGGILLYLHFIDKGMSVLGAAIACITLILVAEFVGYWVYAAVDRGAARVEEYQPESQAISYLHDKAGSPGQPGQPYVPQPAPIPSAASVAPQGQPAAPVVQPAVGPIRLLKEDAIGIWFSNQMLRPAEWSKRDLSWLPPVVCSLGPCENRGSKVENENWPVVCQGHEETVNGILARKSGGDPTAQVQVMGTGRWDDCPNCWTEVWPTATPTPPPEYGQPAATEIPGAQSVCPETGTPGQQCGGCYFSPMCGGIWVVQGSCTSCTPR